MSITALSAIDILFETLANSRKTVDQINKACSNQGLPPAFPIDETGNPNIPGNPDYRFEGFGATLSLPPKLSFWVHYKPESPDHVELGVFTIPIGFGNFLSLKRLLGE